MFFGVGAFCKVDLPIPPYLTCSPGLIGLKYFLNPPTKSSIKPFIFPKTPCIGFRNLPIIGNFVVNTLNVCKVIVF